jgi:drug/metabolite transporter (DMT)-like permease
VRRFARQRAGRSPWTNSIPWPRGASTGAGYRPREERITASATTWSETWDLKLAQARGEALAAAAATGIQVGSAMVATRFVVDQAGPASLALLRYAIALGCLVPFVLVAVPRTRFARRDLLPIALLGIAQFGLLIALLNYGLRVVPSARAALIFATFPLLTMVIAAALGHERLSTGRTVGVVLTVAGVAVALGEKAAGSPAASNDWIGEAAVLASALCGAACSALPALLARYPALPVSAFAMLASVGFLAVLAAPEGFFGALPRFSAGGWLAVVFTGAGSGIGYYLWLWALHHASATEVTVFLALSPITAAWLGALVLGEETSHHPPPRGLGSSSSASGLPPRGGGEIAAALFAGRTDPEPRARPCHPRARGGCYPPPGRHGRGKEPRP